MKESIKKRIEAVRRGEVPEGYCKVHPYVIPYDWNVVKLGNVTKQTSRSNKDGQGRPAYSINNRKGFVPRVSSSKRAAMRISIKQHIRSFGKVNLPTILPE